MAELPRGTQVAHPCIGVFKHWHCIQHIILEKNGFLVFDYFKSWSVVSEVVCYKEVELAQSYLRTSAFNLFLE